ncbi:MAG: hypothetical protein OXF41_09475 [bacterium]|nr:hypothetical protein [bacterium]
MRGRRTIDDVLTGRADVARQWFEAPVLGAALFVIPVVFIEEYSTTGWPQAVAGIANWLIWAVFAAEFAVVISLANSRAGYARMAWLDLLIIVVSFPILPELFALSRHPSTTCTATPFEGSRIHRHLVDGATHQSVLIRVDPHNHH